MKKEWKVLSWKHVFLPSYQDWQDQVKNSRKPCNLIAVIFSCWKSVVSFCFSYLFSTPLHRPEEIVMPSVRVHQRCPPAVVAVVIAVIGWSCSTHAQPPTPSPEQRGAYVLPEKEVRMRCNDLLEDKTFYLFPITKGSGLIMVNNLSLPPPPPPSPFLLFSLSLSLSLSPPPPLSLSPSLSLSLSHFLWFSLNSSLFFSCSL